MTTVERVSLQPAFVLHARAYRETSEIVEVLSRDHGRVSLVARGIRRARSSLRAVLQPFSPVALSWTGRGGGLMTLQAAEPAGIARGLRGTALMAGFYANELLLRFLHRGDPHPQLFGCYAVLLDGLGRQAAADRLLRQFELRLLADVGYGLNLEHDARSGEPIDPGRRYRYQAEQGAVAAEEGADPSGTFSGEELLAIGSGELHEPAHLAGARRLLRAVLDHHLVGRPLRTRQVFMAMRR